MIRSAILSALAVPVLLLSGCLFEESMDMVVYFDNTTDQTVYLRLREDPQREVAYWRIEPGRSHLRLLGHDECKDRWVIADKDDNIIKDPGKICWHDTVTVP